MPVPEFNLNVTKKTNKNPAVCRIQNNWGKLNNCFCLFPQGKVLLVLKLRSHLELLPNNKTSVEQLTGWEEHLQNSLSLARLSLKRLLQPVKSKKKKKTKPTKQKIGTNFQQM